MDKIVCRWILSALPQLVVTPCPLWWQWSDQVSSCTAPTMTHWPQGAWGMQQPTLERGRDEERGAQGTGRDGWTGRGEG